MNVLEAMYCNSYHESKNKESHSKQIRATGTALVTVVLVLNLIFVFVIIGLLWPSITDNVGHFFEDVFGRSSGRMISKLVVLMLFAVVYFPVKYIMGSQKNYDVIIQRFNRLENTEKDRVSKKALRYLLVSIGLFIVAILVLIIFA